MRAETAAAFCDEPSVEAFLSKVERGVYPPSCREKGSMQKWHQHKLAEAIDRRHNMIVMGGERVEDVAELI